MEGQVVGILPHTNIYNTRKGKSERSQYLSLGRAVGHQNKRAMNPTPSGKLTILLPLRVVLNSYYHFIYGCLLISYHCFIHGTDCCLNSHFSLWPGGKHIGGCTGTFLQHKFI